MRLQALTPEWQRLVRWMQEINYGRIENLRLVQGQPCFDPPPQVVREFKARGENDPRPEAALPDFDLKEDVIAFHDDMSRRGNTTVRSLEVKHGVPFRWSVEVTLAA